MDKHYPSGTQENYSNFPSRNLMMEKGKESASMDGIRCGNRYTFYEKNTTYRGKLLEIRTIPSGLRYRPNIQYIYVLCDGLIIIIDTIQIVKIENLSQILRGKTSLNDDVLSVIDEFL